MNFHIVTLINTLFSIRLVVISFELKFINKFRGGKTPTQRKISTLFEFCLKGKHCILAYLLGNRSGTAAIYFQTLTPEDKMNPGNERITCYFNLINCDTI